MKIINSHLTIWWRDSVICLYILCTFSDFIIWKQFQFYLVLQVIQIYNCLLLWEYFISSFGFLIESFQSFSFLLLSNSSLFLFQSTFFPSILCFPILRNIVSLFLWELILIECLLFQVVRNRSSLRQIFDFESFYPKNGSHNIHKIFFECLLKYLLLS